MKPIIRAPFSLWQTPSPPKADCHSPLGKPCRFRPKSRRLLFKMEQYQEVFSKKFGSFRNLSYLCSVKGETE